MRTLWPIPCSGEPGPSSGMCFSIISLVIKPSPPVHPWGTLLRTYYAEI
jgi:hypothetical protein